MLQRLDQARFRGDAPRALKVVNEYYLRWIALNAIVELIVTLEVQVELAPKKVARVDTHLLGHLTPVAPVLQRFYEVIWVVSFATSECVVFYP